MKIAYLMYVHYVSLSIQIWMDLIENLYYLHYIHNVDSTHDTSDNILPPPSQCCFPMLNFEIKNTAVRCSMHLLECIPMIHNLQIKLENKCRIFFNSFFSELIFDV